MKIGFMGTRIRMEKVKKLLEERFPELESIIRTEESYFFQKQIAEELLKLSDNVDAFLFGGRLQYELYHDIFEGIIPCGYLRKDDSALKTALLKLAGRGIDIEKISIDNFSVSTLKGILEDSEFSVDALQILKRKSFKSSNLAYYEDLIRQHTQLYQSGKTQGAITTLSFIYERLLQDGIPCAYVMPSHDSMVRDIIHMKERLEHRMREEDSQIACISMRITADWSNEWSTQDIYTYSQQKLRAAEEIQFFARTLEALVITQADDEYTIICYKSELLEYTRNFRVFPVLQIIWDNCRCDFCVGIGLGASPSEAGMHAQIAMKKAQKEMRNGIFICYNVRNILGPMEYVELNKRIEKERTLQLKSLSEQTGITHSKLLQVVSLAAHSEDGLISVRSLASYMNTSIRAASRLMNQLEELKLIEAVGKEQTGNSGRPANIFKVLISV